MNKKKDIYKFFLMLILLLFTFFYFRLSRYKGFFFNTKGMKDFMEKGIIYNPEVDCFVEDDYFSKNNFKNGSFVDGLCYWGTDFSENLFLLESEDYVSPPYSLKIIAKEFPCRLYYIKNKKFERFSILPWAFKNSSYWLGIRGASA